MVPETIDTKNANSRQYQNSEREATVLKSKYLLNPFETAWAKFTFVDIVVSLGAKNPE